LPFVIPVARGSKHVLADALATGGIFQALNQLRGATIVHPGRNEGGEIVVPGRVRVAISGNIHARSARAVDLGDQFGHSSPVALAGDFEMPDLDWNVSFAADAESFID